MKAIKVLLMVAAIIGVATLASGNDKNTSVIIDVRTALEFKMGHVEGAINIPYDEIGQKIVSAVPDKAQRIYVYCRTGRRSEIAQESLEKLGYHNVINLRTLKNAADVLKRKIVQ